MNLIFWESYQCSREWRGRYQSNLQSGKSFLVTRDLRLSTKLSGLKISNKRLEKRNLLGVVFIIKSKEIISLDWIGLDLSRPFFVLMQRCKSKLEMYGMKHTAGCNVCAFILVVILGIECSKLANNRIYFPRGKNTLITWIKIIFYLIWLFMIIIIIIINHEKIIIRQIFRSCRIADGSEDAEIKGKSGEFAAI